MANGLRENVQRSVKWTALVTGLNTITQPIYRILLAALLLPTEFAYIAVVTLISSFATLLNNIGIGEAIIQRDNITSKDTSTLFFFNLFITLVFTNLLFWNAEYIQSFYEMEYLTVIIKLISVTIFVNGVTSIFKFYLHRLFYFKETSIIKIIKTSSEVIIVLVLIFAGLNIWGFVWGTIISNIINAILLTIFVFKLTDFKIEFYFSFEKLKRFFSFGFFVSLKKIVTFFGHRIDEIIIGGVLSSEILGIYYLAKNVLLQIQTLITISFAQVLLPTFSKIKNDIPKLKELYLKIISILVFVGLPIFLFIMLAADLYVPIIFGEEWIASATVFQWLAIPVFLMLLSASVSTSLIYSQNKTVPLFLVELIIVVIYAFALNIFHNEGLYNITIIYATFVITNFFATKTLVLKALNLQLKEVLITNKQALVSGLITAIVLVAFQSYRNDMNEIIFLIAFLVLGSLVYLITNLLINMKNLKQYMYIFKGIIKSK